MRWRSLSLAVATASFSTMALELALTRVFSVTMFYHFAFMVISIAMLGLSVAGVAIYLMPKLFQDRRAPLVASIAMLAFSVLTVWVLRSALQHPVNLSRWRDNLVGLIGLYITAALAMLSSGVAVSMAIAAAKERIGQVYAFDLAGAALGCVLVIPALSLFGGAGAVIAVAAVGALSALVFALSIDGRDRPRLRIGLAAVAGIAAVVFGFMAITEEHAKRFGSVRNPSKFLGNREVIFEKWNSFSQITVAPSGAPDSRWIFIDADAATRLWSGSASHSAPRRYGEVRVASLVYAIRHERPALIIGPGGGTDVKSALHYGVPKVVGVEVNPIIVDDVVKGKFADYAGHIYSDPRVQVVVDEGRSYVRRSPEAFGSIQATLVDTWAASSSGAFTLTENNLYTVEAFDEFFAHLAPGGVVAVTRWYDVNRPAEFLRLVALARESLERRGVQPSEAHRHFVLATDNERRGTLLASRDPFAPTDLRALAEEASRGGIRFLFLPEAPDEPQGTAGDGDRLLAGFLRAADAHAFLDRLPYDASPTTDDRPFFFYNLRARDALSIVGRLGSVEINNLGIAVLSFLLILSIVLTVIFVVVPLFVLERTSLRQERRRKLRVLGYFLSLGVGFIMVEVGFMQSFVLFLGHPIYALSVILAGLLAASGAGSALSGSSIRRFGVEGHAQRAIVALAVVLVGYSFLLSPLFRGLLSLPLAARIAIATVLVVIPGLLMGTLLPAGVRIGNQLGQGTVPWGWGLNGAASVVGSILAVIIAMNGGFRIALLCGISAYVVGMILLPNARSSRLEQP